MDLQTLGAIIGILSGVFTLVGGVIGAWDRLHPTAREARVPVPAGSYSQAPPVSSISGPYSPLGGPGPAPGYRPPSYPQPVTPQPGYQQSGAPAPYAGYSGPQPQGPRGGVPQPVTPNPAWQQPPYVTYAPRSKIMRWIHYPWVLLGSAVYLLLGGIYSAAYSSSSTTTDTTASNDPVAIFLSLLILAAYVATVVYAARQAIRLKRWGWLTSVILIGVYGPVAFGIWGPTTPPQPQPAYSAQYPPYPPRRM